MCKRMWLAAAVVVLLSGAPVLWGSTVQAADNGVAMTDQLKFEPGTITVQAGTTVVWQNDGYAQHDVKARDGSFKSNGMLNKGETFEFKFTTPGATYEYICTPHESAGMTGVVKVLGGGSTPTTGATTTTAPAGGTTTTTAAGQPATTTTTATGKAGAASSSSTTTAPAANGATTTTLASSASPASASDTADESTTTTAAGQGGGEEAAADHNAEGRSHNKKEKKNSPIGIAFASVSTLLLAAIAGKLLASKS